MVGSEGLGSEASGSEGLGFRADGNLGGCQLWEGVRWPRERLWDEEKRGPRMSPEDHIRS